MRFIPAQCKQCPFRSNSWPGYLGEYSPGDVFKYIWHGQPFFCHSTINYRNPNWLARAMKVGKLCTGGLVAANNAPAPVSAHPQIISARQLVREVKGLDVMGWREFMEHHEKKK